jgi:hypothetical protein
MKDMRLALHARTQLQSTNLMGNFVTKRLNAFAILMAVGMICGQAQARTLQVIGTAGYLSEWELNGSVTEKGPPAAMSSPEHWSGNMSGCAVQTVRKKDPAKSNFRSPNQAHRPGFRRR